MHLNKKNRAQELLNETNESLARKFGNSVETEMSDEHTHTISADTDITSFNSNHHHNVPETGNKTGPAVYLDGSTKDTHTHKFDRPVESDREMPQLPSSV